MAHEQNPYELLELTTEATEADIRRAYRQRSLKIHPDKVRYLLAHVPR
jgi:DnaJ family protein C protein 17